MKKYLLAIIISIAAINILLFAPTPVNSQTLPHATYTTAIAGTVNEYIFYSGDANDAGLSDWYGYYFKDGKWYAATYNVKTTDFTQRYTGPASTDNPDAKLLKSLKGSTLSEGINKLLEQQRSAADGTAYIGYTDTGGYKKLDNTTYKNNPTKFKIGSDNKIEIGSSSTRSPDPGMSTISPTYNPVKMSWLYGTYISQYFKVGTLPEYLSKFYIWAMALGIVAAIAMIVWGGYTYSTSGGDLEKINDAKEKIVGAVLGLILLLAAALILRGLGVAKIGDNINTNTSPPPTITILQTEKATTAPEPAINPPA